MSMNTDLQLVLRFLGPEGAKQGLVHSTLTSPELLDLLGDGQSSLSSKPSREEVAHEIAYKNSDRIGVPAEALSKMSAERLLEYFHQTKPSRAEIIRLLMGLGVRVSSDAKRNLVAFASSEISDIGVYQRVAKGNHPDRR